MKPVFRSEAKITQYFGDNPKTYAKFGLPGHEGLDLVPRGKDWTVLSPVDAEVKSCYTSETYGETVILWSPEYGLSFRFAHLSEIYVCEGRGVPDQHPIGVMGNTGNSFGAHLHMNVIPMVMWDMRAHKNNGWRGRVDPLPVLWMLGMIEPAIGGEAA